MGLLVDRENLTLACPACTLPQAQVDGQSRENVNYARWLYAPTYLRILIRIGLQQSQLVGPGYGFGASLDLQLVKDDSGMSLDRAQGEEEPFADLTIRESLGDEP